ncbi:hypothetical protein BS012_RS23180 [Vibrio parahaemolyticus]|nr:hypothetical protein [Vibrio parahaemolyticus]EIE7521319.1 hypothetical protein [Vibrio parahaemolyticus]EJC7971375.1 hypothetical protein [Vibrio parahaemolyticus]EJG2040279.1 hypothetical protein [Vibrio parahaemolyticus]EJG2044954.1 hypothetical protein [Vibrio parahaemolyticus]
MANCRGNCQANMLRGKYTQSDFEPVTLKAIRHDLQMKQPTNIGMFYWLRDSRIWADNADLLRQLE